MKSDFRLEHFALTKMHADWVAPVGTEEVMVDHIASNFACHVFQHQTVARQFKIEFAARLSQRTSTGTRIGFQVEAQLAALVTVSDAVPAEKLGSFVHANAVNTLYGTLRGLVASATGVFPFGPLIVPSLSAKEILASIQTQQPPAPGAEPAKGRATTRRSVTPSPTHTTSRK
jgi:preprotein translocase subunit SecB